MSVEKVEVKYMRSRGNLYHVPVEQWRKWGAGARQVFNEVYSAMVGSRGLFLHPEQEEPSRSHWRTMAWNAAWTAASATNGL